jgi:tetratricopeptide (TPR) repeat protein
MHASKCFRESNGRLGCISCHDPHKVPAPEERVAYFREKCLACHEQAGCRLPSAERTARIPNDSCVSCHMPSFAKTEISHVASTDHRILRELGLDGPRTQGPSAETAPLVPFHTEERAAMNRELDIALTLEAQLAANFPIRPKSLVKPIYRVEAPRSPSADDPPARLAWARSLRLQGRRREALTVYDSLGDEEAAIDERASLALELGDRPAAQRYARQAVTLNPWSSGLHERLANVLALDQKWEEAGREAVEALRLNPFRPLARKILIQSHLNQSDTARAKAEFETLMALNPAERAALQNWFDQQKRP